MPTKPPGKQRPFSSTTHRICPGLPPPHYNHIRLHVACEAHCRHVHARNANGARMHAAAASPPNCHPTAGHGHAAAAACLRHPPRRRFAAPRSPEPSAAQTAPVSRCPPPPPCCRWPSPGAAPCFRRGMCTRVANVAHGIPHPVAPPLLNQTRRWCALPCWAGCANAAAAWQSGGGSPPQRLGGATRTPRRLRRAERRTRRRWWTPGAAAPRRSQCQRFCATRPEAHSSLALPGMCWHCRRPRTLRC